MKIAAYSLAGTVPATLIVGLRCYGTIDAFE